MAWLLTVAPTRAAGCPVTRSAGGAVGSGGASGVLRASPSGFCERVTGRDVGRSPPRRAAADSPAARRRARPNGAGRAHPQTARAKATSADAVPLLSAHTATLRRTADARRDPCSMRAADYTAAGGGARGLWRGRASSFVAPAFRHPACFAWIGRSFFPRGRFHEPGFFWHLLRDTFNNWLEDRAFRMGAALAYYSVFSMAPLLLIAIGVASQIFDKEAARQQILGEIATTVGPSASDSLEKILEHAGGAGNGVVATIIGVAMLLFGASGVFAELQDALNNIWKVKPKPGLGIMAMVRDRLLSFTVVLGTGFLLLVSLVLSAALAALGAWMEQRCPGMSWLWQS